MNDQQLEYLMDARGARAVGYTLYWNIDNVEHQIEFDDLDEAHEAAYELIDRGIDEVMVVYYDDDGGEVCSDDYEDLEQMMSFK